MAFNSLTLKTLCLIQRSWRYLFKSFSYFRLPWQQKLLSNKISVAITQTLRVLMCSQFFLWWPIRMLLTTVNLVVYVSHSNGCYGDDFA